jgi:membrane-associated phospholipid phosphatase
VKSLLQGTAVAVVLAGVAVVVCYFFVDRPVSLWVHRHIAAAREDSAWPATASGWSHHAAVTVIVLVLLWRLIQRGGRLQTTLLAASASLVVAAILKQLLKWGFGRAWPNGHGEDHPSLVHSGIYGFHPFGQYMTGAFPSGHAALTFAVISVLWIGYPRWRWLWAAAGGGLCVALVALNYHFVGDVIAGGVLGWLTGLYAARAFHLAGRDLPGVTA